MITPLRNVLTYVSSTRFTSDEICGAEQPSLVRARNAKAALRRFVVRYGPHTYCESKIFSSIGESGARLRSLRLSRRSEASDSQRNSATTTTTAVR